MSILVEHRGPAETMQTADDSSSPVDTATRTHTQDYSEAALGASYNCAGTSTLQYQPDHDDIVESDCLDSHEDTDYDGIVTALMTHPAGKDYYPFPSKVFALLYLLVHSPRRIGDVSLEYLLSVIRLCGVSVPSLKTLKTFNLPEFVRPQRCITDSGLPYYVNSLSNIIKQTMGNPKVAKHLARYPIEPQNCYRELFHGERWREDPRFATPMAILENGDHIHLYDCVYLHHPIGIVTAIVCHFFQKEGQEDVFAEVDIILDMAKFKAAVPESVLYYLPPGTMILFDHITVSTSSFICCATERPVSLAIWNDAQQCLEDMPPDMLLR